MFKNVKLGTKILGSVVPILILLGFVAWVAYNGFNKVADRVEKGDDVNRLVKNILETRRQEKNFILRGDEEYITAVKNNLAEIKKQAEASKNRFKAKANRDQMDQVVNSVSEYGGAFDVYTGLRRERNNALERIEQFAESAIKESRDIGAEQKGQLDSIRSLSMQEIAETQWAAEAAGEVIYMVFDARSAEKNFQLTSFDKYAKQMDELGAQINQLLENIAKKLNKEPGKSIATEALASSRAYFEGFKELAQMTRNMEYVRAAEVNEQVAANFDNLVKKTEELTSNQKVVLAEIRDKAARQTQDKMEKADATNDLVRWFLEARLAEKDFISSNGQLMYLDAVNAKVGNILSLCDDLDKRFTQPRNKERISTVVNAVRDYLSEFSNIAALMEKQKMAENTMVESARAAIKVCTVARQDQKNKMDGAISSTTRNMLLVALGAIIIGITLALFITRSITRPIHNVITGLNEGAEQVASASGQVSSSSQSLAEGASQQAASLEETSSSLEEMSSMTRQNAQNAGQANNLMKETSLIVQRANASMGELIRSISEISQASAETSKIIKTIDEIAFQTNLLALNAAVEAARAGEAGAGFAVVADEVRNLATRAAEAARNTSVLIEKTMDKVAQGTDLVEKTNEAFGEVGTSASRVGDIVGEIAEASNEQSQGIEQVNKAVTEMDKVTQQNAANAEESASASEELNAQAEQMKGMVAQLSKIVGGKGQNPKVKKNMVKAEPRHHAKTPAKPSAAHGKVVEPKQVIPMDDEDFRDF